jgi:hypothetical protein
MINQNWYNLNSSRRYPLDDVATGENDVGVSMPHDIIVDCHLRYPELIGIYAYVSSVHLSEHLVSVTLLAANVPAVTTDCLSSDSISEVEFVPLGAVSVPRAELLPGRQYAIDAHYPGVGGWIVFGPGIQDTEYFGRFSTVAQGMLCPRVARAYPALPIPSMAKIHQADALTGLVNIRAGNDIKIVKDQRMIQGEIRDALVLSLDTANSASNLLDRYRGPCSGRPESKTCSKPAIESINGVRPDCNGNIELELTTTCVDVGDDVGGGGQVVDYCFGLGEACLPGDLPVDGRLPNDYDDQCLTVEGSAGSDDIAPVDPDEETGLITVSSSSCSLLPLLETFTTLDSGWAVMQGAFVLGGGSWTANTKTLRNIAVWADCIDFSVLDKTCTIDLQLSTDTVMPEGGLLIGWNDSGGYYLADIYKPGDRFRVRYYTGAHFVDIGQTTPMGLRYDVDYTIEVRVADLGGGQAQVRCRLYDGANLLTTISFTTTQLNDPGLFGLQASKSLTAFKSFLLEDS